MDDESGRVSLGDVWAVAGDGVGDAVVLARDV